MSEYLWHHWAKRAVVTDPVLLHEPHDLWMLPASLADYGPFTLICERDFERGPSRKLYLDIEICLSRERFTLILPLTRHTSTWLTRWQSMDCPKWKFVAASINDGAPRWAIERVENEPRPYRPIG